MQKNTASRTVTLAIGSSGLSATNSGTGNYLYLEFLIPRLNYFLDGGYYTVANNTEAKAGNYIEGNENIGSHWVEVAGGVEVKRLQIKEGTLFVTKNDDNYTISGTVMLEDGSMIKIIYMSVIVFDPDVVVYTYTLEIETPANITFPIPGSRMNRITVLADDMFTAYFEVVTADDATSLSGNYAITNGINAIGQANIGYCEDWSSVGGETTESGSYYLDGEAKMFIRDGNINIVDNNGALTITGNNLTIQDIANSFGFITIALLPTPGSINYQNMTVTE